MSSKYEAPGGSGGGGSGTIDGTLTAGRIAYAQDSDTLTDDADFTYDATNDLLTVTKVKAQNILEVENATGSVIAAGSAVYVSAIGTGKPQVALADSDDAAKMPSVGIVTNQIANGASGFVAINGQLNGLDRTTASGPVADADITTSDIGKTLYVSTTPGKMTVTRPTGTSALIQNVGRIIDVNGSNFKMQVSNIGRANDVPNQFSTQFIDFADAKGIRDSNENEQLIFQETASAVNYLEITNAATGSDVKISTAGSDTNVGVEIESKGSGLITLDGNVLCGAVTGSQGTAARALNLIGDDAVMRIARTSNTNDAPAMELMHLSADGNTSKGHFDIYLYQDSSTSDDIMSFRDRKIGAPGVDILTMVSESGATDATGVRVGIKNTSPTHDLDVGGSFRATGATTVAGAATFSNTATFQSTATLQQGNIATGDISPAAAAADAGKYFYRASTETTPFTLPTITNVGEQYVLLNNSGSALTISSAQTVVGSTSIPDGQSATIICVAAATWFVVG